ncbi:DNA-3-methyladenine glycosylase family protein [Amycolatopsis saalfeldensis]|uniref:DNA-3-methyladenine glycosylase II n=1 Tax=Amycolatopsis saalfeldensis TaxID=394193 RepID=A0A1H8YL58_9PSEU|nr:DNA-3-methyladenine glycosylase [Amycolatopsis saalfeldensis]SEP52869.1 DNA-3-methyladenine glycosylase II [Amycolatopsis saalfeldensis]
MTTPILARTELPTGEIAVRGPFELSAATRFLAGFGPAGRPDAAAEPGVLRLAFPSDGDWRHVGATIRQRTPGEPGTDVFTTGSPSPVFAGSSDDFGAVSPLRPSPGIGPSGRSSHGPAAARSFSAGPADPDQSGRPLSSASSAVPGAFGTVEVEVSAPVEAAGRVLAQVGRMLSLDVDGSGFTGLGFRDPVLAGLQARRAGLRPVLFSSPYEAGCWSVLAQGMRFSQAMRLRRRLAERYGKVVEVGGYRVLSFPTPGVLADLPFEPGLADFRTARLRAVAKAAAEGRLDPAELRAMRVADALERLREIPGIGQFSAEQILARGAGHPDFFPRADGRLHHAMREEYGLLDSVGPADLELLAGAWRPYRSWAALLLRVDRDAVPIMEEVMAA